MERTTVMLPGDLKEKAMFKAHEMGISFGELIRKSIKSFIDEIDIEVKIDPFLDDDEIYTGEVESDISLNHDKYLYEE